MPNSCTSFVKTVRPFVEREADEYGSRSFVIIGAQTLLPALGYHRTPWIVATRDGPTTSRRDETVTVVSTDAPTRDRRTLRDAR